MFRVKVIQAAIVITSILGLCGCSKPAVSEPESKKMLLSDSSIDASCRSEDFHINRQAYSPDRFDQDRFYGLRYNKTNNTIKYPLPALCIYRVYGDDHLRMWAGKGDIIAKYVLFQVNYRRDCTRIKSDADFLYSIGQIEFKNRYGIVISRLPEAYEVLANMQLMCGMADASDASSALAYKAGYQSQMTFME